MRCELALGRHAEVLELLRRCAAQLSSGLGIAPSPVTQALAARARSGAAWRKNPGSLTDP
jgi:Bacterial transcriptional activator domain